MRGRLRTLEAMAFATLARFLIRFVPMAGWGRWLGEAETIPGSLSPAQPSANGDAPLPAGARHCAAAVRRAVLRLPGTICLPQAIALHWMLGRRRISSTIILGILPVSERSGPDTLHAWVNHDGRPVLGHSNGRHASLLQFRRIF